MKRRTRTWAVVDIETKTVGPKPDPNADIPVFVGIKNARTGVRVMYHISRMEHIFKCLSCVDVFIGHNFRAYDMVVLTRYGFGSCFYDGKYPKLIIDTYEIIQTRAKPMMYLDFSQGEMNLRNLLRFFNLGTQKGDIDYEVFKQDRWTMQELREIQSYLFDDLDGSYLLFRYLYDMFSGLAPLMNEKDQMRLKWLTASPGAAVYKIICNLTGLPEEYDDVEDATVEPYEGAFVALPTKDREDSDCYVVDFRSLYPHMFMGGNLFSPVPPGTAGSWHGGGIYTPIESCSDGDGVRGWYSRTPGVVESLLSNLLSDRMAIQARIKTEELNDEQRETLERQSLANKIVLNTAYGLTGSPKFKSLYRKDTAADCTAMGRLSIKHARAKLTALGYDCMYTDSVAGTSEVIYRINADTFVEPIESMWLRIENECSSTVTDMGDNRLYLTWSESVTTYTINPETHEGVWREVKYLMSHKNTKKCYKIRRRKCKRELILTEDHSLMMYHPDMGYAKAKPSRLLPSSLVVPYQPAASVSIPTTTDHLWDFFARLIATGYTIDGDVIKVKISAIHPRDTLAKIVGAFTRTGYAGTMVESSSFIRGIRSRGCVSMIKKLGLPLNATGEKTVLYEFSSDDRVFTDLRSPARLSLARVLLAHPAVKRTGSMWKIRHNHRVTDYFIHRLLASFGIVTQYIVSDDGKDVASVLCHERDMQRIQTLICPEHSFWTETDFEPPSMEHPDLVPVWTYKEVNYTGWVYDMEVEDTHTFFANGILCHNTDSIYFKDPYGDIEQVKKVIAEISEEQIGNFNVPIKTHCLQLEAEITRIYFFKNDAGEYIKKFYLYCKKGKEDKPVIKGLRIVKGDCSPVAKLVWERHIKPKAVAGDDLIIDPTVVLGWVRDIFREDPSLMTKRFRTKDPSSYKPAKGHDTPTSIQYTIALTYGAGEHYMIPNMSVGVGKSKKYATLEELTAEFGDHWIDHIDFSGTMSDLKHFLDPVDRKQIKKKAFYVS